MSASIEQLLDELRVALGVQRATVRVDVPDAYFPVAYESLAPGTGSLRDDSTDLRTQPVPRILAESDGQVVQEDSAAAFPDDAAFHEMRERYGGMRSQIVTGCYRGRRSWSHCSRSTTCARRGASARHERGLCRAAAAEVAERLDDTA